MKTNKRHGISLIVLVITIIVMIILAAAIILSISGDGIIEKANQATTENDMANKREAAEIALAEYELANRLGKISEGETATSYVQKKLESQGMHASDIKVTEEGILLVGLKPVKEIFEDVKIGTQVKGYMLEEGKETYELLQSESGTLDQTLKRDENITWKYMGLDENENIMLLGSVTSNSPQMKIAGKTGYLNGPTMLDDANGYMYSSNMGTARSINIDDVTMVLEYTGEKGAYSNDEDSYIELETPKTIGQIVSEGETKLKLTETPDGSDINNYYANYYKIHKTNDASEYNTEKGYLIYPSSSTTDLTKSYWLASSCTSANFSDVVVSYAEFGLRIALSSSVNYTFLFNPYVFSASAPCYAIRPVVCLSSSVQAAIVNGIVYLSI